MAEPSEWANLKLTREVTLVLGYRPRPGTKELVSKRVELKKDLQERLAVAATGWLQDLQTRTRVSYQSDLHLDPDEYLSTSITELVSHAPTTSEQLEPEVTPSSELHSILINAFESDDWFTASELKRAFLFYAIAVRSEDGGTVAFVRQTGPQRVAKTGGWITAFDNTLREMEDPVFVLEPDTDLVVHGDDVAVLRPLAFERLFADLELSRELIPQHVETITDSLPCTAEFSANLEASSGKKVRARRLLRDISAFTPEQWAVRTTARIREVLKQRELAPSDFFDDAGNLAAEGAQIQVFLEVIASRYFTSDFDEEEMRADKVRRRTS